MDEEEEKQMEEVEVKDETFILIRKEGIAIAMMAVKKHETPKFHAFIAKDLAIMNVIVGKNKSNKLIILEEKRCGHITFVL